jgi:excisionase family DNA binding protein
MSETKQESTERKIFTTSEVAKICKVAPRTVSKWFDSGRLKGYRIPGSQDRRIPREYLVKFLHDHGMGSDDVAMFDDTPDVQ